MIELAATSGQTYAVMGLGASGLATVEALERAGARVLAWDDDAGRRATAIERGMKLTDLAQVNLAGTAALLLSPGIPHTYPKPHPTAEAARRAGVPILCDIDLLLGANAKAGARVIGITGTNGKSTVTALIGHCLTAAGVSCSVGGNLGPAALGLAPQGTGGAYVLELSSYQIERIATAGFDVAVLINITPDHLDRHGGMAGYIAAKEKLFELMRGPRSVAVIGADNSDCRAVANRLRASGKARVVAISAERSVEGGIWVEGGRIMDATTGAARLIADISSVGTLPGTHNWQNAAAATAALLAFGLAPERIAEGLASYPGLPHRQERLRRIGDVTYINDSKATNADAALRAIVCYDDIFWIAGGLAKDGGFAALAPGFGRIRHAYLIGKAAADIAATIEGRIAFTMSGTLDAALAAAHEAAQGSRRSAVVLLSPACASFDQFANFEARGNAFRQMVAALPETAGVTP